MHLDDTIISLLSSYQLPAILIGAFFLGETVIIPAAFLAAQGFWSLINVFWLALAGTLMSDALWFLFGRRILLFFHKWEKYQKQSARLLKALEKISGQRSFLALLFIKFFYGTRILTIMYLSVRQVRFFTFLFFDTIGTMLWLAVILSIGWLAGKSMINLAPFLNKFEYAVLFLILVIIIFRFGTTWLRKKITKE